MKRRPKTTIRRTGHEFLPVPRLELRWVPAPTNGDRYNWFCRYDLVTRHLLGQVHATSMGGTWVGNGGREPFTAENQDFPRGGLVDIPFRDGAHIRHDAAELHLPAFAIYGERVTVIAADYRGDYAWGSK